MTGVTVLVEPLTSYIRICPREGAVHGDPYLYTLGVRWLNPKEAEIIGLNFKMTTTLWKAIQDAMAEQGAERVMFKRVNEDMTESVHWVDTRRKER